MKSIACILLSLCFFLPAFAGEAPPDRRSLNQQLVGMLDQFSGNIDALVQIQKQMEDSKQADTAYDQKKNIWLSSVLTFSAIASICEYQSDHLELFLDLRPENQTRYAAVRMESLGISIQQIDIFKKQIQINRSIIGKNDAHLAQWGQEDKLIQLLIDRLQACRSILQHYLQ